MLQDPKPPMNHKKRSLTIHPDASTKMYGINKYIYIYIRVIDDFLGTISTKTRGCLLHEKLNALYQSLTLQYL